MPLTLNQIVPWGRTRAEYIAMFGLGPEDLRSRILDCGGGPASFCAEQHGLGFRVIAVDPIYSFSGTEIRSRFETVADSIMSQVRAKPNDWVWSFHRGPDDLLASRRAAIDRFLPDYETGRGEGRYLNAELPSLPFETGAFDLAVCSHLLFLYSDFLSDEFHARAVLELCRVAREVRIFPLLTLKGEPSPRLAQTLEALRSAGRKAEIVQVSYELQPGGNQMLRIV